MPKIKIASLVILLLGLTQDFTFAQDTKILQELVFACPVQQEILGGEPIELCILGHSNNTPLSRDIKLSDGLKIEAEIIIGNGAAQLSTKKQDGFDLITITPDNQTSLLTIEITGTYENTEKNLFISFIVTKNPNIPEDSEKNPSTASFLDITSKHTNYKAIENLFARRIIEGYSDGSFKPDQEINRAEFLKILIESRDLTPDYDKHQNCFADIGKEWFAKYICFAKEQKWIEGYPEKNRDQSTWLFHPEATVNKVEALKMAINVFDLNSNLTHQNFKFTDIPENAWYISFISKAIDLKIIDERAGKLNPGSLMTRGQISEIVYRLLSRETF